MEQISTIYNEAVQLIKSAILQNQLDAAKAVNQQMLALYYGVGKYVSENTRHGTWGTGAIETISKQLRRSCQDCVALVLQILKTCVNFMRHGALA